ncbi:ATP-binding cassette domain-containing protein [Microbacterium enclense]|uniref:ABC transporter ATP-binding protein n=1 Tax=Microbacterium enclense TaxID=993073 RepID=UPI003D74C7DA
MTEVESSGDTPVVKKPASPRSASARNASSTSAPRSPRTPADKKPTTPRTPAAKKPATPRTPAAGKPATARTPASGTSATPRTPAAKKPATPRTPAAKKPATPRTSAEKKTAATPRTPAKPRTAAPPTPVTTPAAAPDEIVLPPVPVPPPLPADLIVPPRPPLPSIGGGEAALREEASVDADPAEDAPGEVDSADASPVEAESVDETPRDAAPEVPADPSPADVAVEEPKIDGASAEAAGSEEPAFAEPVPEEPVVAEPNVDEPVSAEPDLDEAVIAEPTVDQPIAVEEAAQVESVVDAPAVEGPRAEPAADATAVDDAFAAEDPTPPDVAVDETAVEPMAPEGTSPGEPADDVADPSSEPAADGEAMTAGAVIAPREDADSDTASDVPALRLRNVTKTFGEVRAVDGVDLTVPAGSFYGLVGPNGAGKTTTLSIIAGLLRSDGGTVEINGVDAAHRSRAAKKMIGVLPDRLRTFDRLTGRQLLSYYGALRGLPSPVVESRAADLARAFDLVDALGRPVSDYSAGMTKKVMLAGAMIHSPRLLVLDEPFEAVDPVSSAVILDILRAYVEHGGTVILSSHGMELVERVCSRVAVIVAGQVLAEGTVDEVRGESTLEQRFLELAGGLGDVEGLEWLHTFSA